MMKSDKKKNYGNCGRRSPKKALGNSEGHESLVAMVTAAECVGL